MLRLWCVFEAYLGVQWKKIYVLPIKPSRPLVAAFWWKNCGRFMLAGIATGSPAFWYLRKFGLSSNVTRLHIIGRCFGYISLSWQVFTLPCSHSRYAMCIASSMSFIGGVMLMIGLAWSWNHDVSVRCYNFVISVFHYGWTVNLALMNCLTTVLLAFNILEAKEFERQENMMQFESLRMAHCSNQDDEDRIRAEISGSETEVETVIRILINSGAYTDSLRQLWDSGISIDRKGSTDFTIATAWATLVWVFTAADCLFCAIADPAVSTYALQLAICCLLVVALILISGPQCQRKGPDQALIALRMWQIIGMVSLQLPCIVTIILQGGEDLSCRSWGRCQIISGWISLENQIDWFVLPLRATSVVLAAAVLFLQGIYYLGCRKCSNSRNYGFNLLDEATTSSDASSEDGRGSSDQ